MLCYCVLHRGMVRVLMGYCVVEVELDVESLAAEVELDDDG